jgi:hypothetical protein
LNGAAFALSKALDFPAGCAVSAQTKKLKILVALSKTPATVSRSQKDSMLPNER